MGSLYDILNTIHNAIRNDEGFDLADLDKEVVELHRKLTEPQWAIEDEALREECEKLVISWAVKRYLTDRPQQATPQKEGKG